jgi:hypothetical protein
VLSRRRIRVRARGKYPNGTPVAEVAVYQNDGTARIAASHFVERAAAAASDWHDAIEKVTRVFIFLDAPLMVPLQIETDISAACDRVKTGRLKTSFEGEIVNGP